MLSGATWEGDVFTLRSVATAVALVEGINQAENGEMGRPDATALDSSPRAQRDGRYLAHGERGSALDFLRRFRMRTRHQAREGLKTIESDAKADEKDRIFAAALYRLFDELTNLEHKLDEVERAARRR
jgi:hypothetical protein